MDFYTGSPVGRQGERDEAGESEGSWHLSMAGGQPVVGVAGKATNSALYCHSRSPSISSRETLDNFLISVNPVDFVLLRLSHIQKVRQLHAKLRLRMVTYDLRRAYISSEKRGIFVGFLWGYLIFCRYESFLSFHVLIRAECEVNTGSRFTHIGISIWVYPKAKGPARLAPWPSPLA